MTISSALKQIRAVFTAFWDTFLVNNVVLVQAAGLFPVLAMGYNLKYGVALSLCTAAVLIPVSIGDALLSRRIPNWLRPALYVVLSSALLFGVALVLRQYVSPMIYAHLYVFLPLMAVNTLFLLRPAASTADHRVGVTIAAALGSALGFALVLCVACALREMAINGTLWDIPLGYAARFPEAEHPFIGFVLLGFMAATLQWIKQLLRKAIVGRKGDDR